MIRDFVYVLPQRKGRNERRTLADAITTAVVRAREARASTALETGAALALTCRPVTGRTSGRYGWWGGGVG